MKRIEHAMTWMPREEAEQSPHLVQPIPCTIVADPWNRYSIFQRVDNARPDLRNRRSLVIGGHVETQDVNPRNGSLIATLARTLTREIREELDAPSPELITPLAIVQDPTTGDSARHVAFVHLTIFTQPVQPRPNGEFVARRTTAILPPERLRPILHQMDPWSRTVTLNHLLEID